MQKLPNPASLTHDERMQYRAANLFSVCKGAVPETLDDGSAIYTADKDGRFYLQIFAGKALRTCRSLSGYYRTTDSRAQTIEKFKLSIQQHLARQFLRRQAARKPHTLKVGDVLNTSWGYEQTNVDFYEIVAVSGSMVTLRQIAASLTENGDMCGMTVPQPGKFIGEPLRRRANAYNRVNIHSCASAGLWDGNAKYVSWYA